MYKKNSLRGEKLASEHHGGKHAGQVRAESIKCDKHDIFLACNEKMSLSQARDCVEKFK